jgi:hypothetical protein
MKAIGRKIATCLTHWIVSPELDEAQGWNCPVFGCRMLRLDIKTFARWVK